MRPATNGTVEFFKGKSDKGTPTATTAARLTSPSMKMGKMKDPGKILQWNIDDDNGNDRQDRLDAYPFLDPNGIPVIDYELQPAALAIQWPIGVQTGLILQLTTGANTRLFAARDRQPVPLSIC